MDPKGRLPEVASKKRDEFTRMTSERDIASDLLRRLIAGERGTLSLHLALLLERSLALGNSDDHYRQLLPAELADVRLTEATVREAIATLCSEISRNPDAALIAAVSTTGADEVTRLASEILINPPRPLTMRESGQALAIAYAYLPSFLGRNKLFLSEQRRAHLIDRLKALERVQNVTISRHASLLLKSLPE